MRILIVEDDLSLCRVFEVKLKMHCVQIARDPDQALEMLEHNEYDLIFLDYDLGVKGSGITSEPVAKYINENKLKAQIVIHTSSMELVKKLQDIIGRECYVCEKTKLVVGDTLYLYAPKDR